MNSRRFCHRNGIAIIAYSPFGSPDLPWGEKLPHILIDPVLKSIAEKHSKSTALVCLRWLLQRGLPTIPKVMIFSSNISKKNFELLRNWIWACFLQINTKNNLSLYFKSVIERELLENLKVFEAGFVLTEADMEAINRLNKNLRKIVPINKLKNGEVVLRDGKSRHFPFTYEEPLE